MKNKRRASEGCIPSILMKVSNNAEMKDCENPRARSVQSKQTRCCCTISFDSLADDSDATKEISYAL